MTNELIRVIMTGICTFVDADVGDNNRPVTAVFANASHHDPAHHVSLIVSAQEYDVDTDLGSTLEYSELGKPFRIVLLDGKSIALRGVRSQVFDLADEIEPKENYPTRVDELESVEWIPSLRRSWPRMFPFPAARRMKRGFYSVAADTQLVSASFELPNGRLASHWVNGDIWRFSPRTWTRMKYETAVAQEVRLDSEISGQVIHFDVCDLETGRHCGYVRISRRNPADDDERMQVVLANVPDEDRVPGSTLVFCGECGRSECENKNDPFPCTCVDRHYANYYHALTSDLPDRPSLPRRMTSYPSLMPVALRVGGGNCPPADYP